MKESTIKTGGRLFGNIMETKAKQDLRYQPLYSLTEVSRYTRVQPATLRSWTRNGDAAGIVMLSDGPRVAPFSFINLIEAYVLAALRRTYRLPMQRIRKGEEWLRRTYHVANPLAELNLETDGYDLFIREMDVPINASRKGQCGFPEVLARYLQRIERDNGKIPVRFYPYTYNEAPKIIVMDPAVAYGRPVVAGTRVTSQMIFDRYSGGESLNDIAADYDLDISLIEEALRCEIERIAA
jgi:uncharacterized protein (DUF433 family)